MHEHFYLIHRYTKEPLGFNHLKAFIHHGSGVDSYLGAHIPIGVLEGLSSRHLAHLVECIGTEWSTTGSEKNFLYLTMVLTHEALEDSTMFAIHRQYRRVVLLCQGAYDFSCHNERFLISECDSFACFDGFYRRAQTCVSHHRRHDDIDTWHGYHLCDGIFPCPHFDFQVTQCLA